MNKVSKFNNERKVNKDIIIVTLLFIMSIVIYLWTIKLPIIGDGLMHLSDETHFSSIKDFIKIFYTFDGLGKPEVAPTLGFHRPIFNELIIPSIKYITNCNTVYIRMISVIIHAINTVLSYYLCKTISKNRYIGLLGSIVFCTNIIYFNGIYEFGLSFSLWLTLFSLLAFLFTIKYEQEENKIYLIISLISSFLAVFTKESAVVLGVALSFYMLVKCIINKRKIDKRTTIYIIIQCVIIIMYFTTRYYKLGSVFAIAGGIESKFSLEAIITKLIGYFFILFNIPNKAIPSYMIGYLDRVNILIAISLIILTLIILIKGLKLVIESPLKNINIIIAIIMYCILIASTFKVNRNSSYYADIAMLAILLYISSLNLSSKKTFKNILSIYVIIYSITFFSLVNSMVSDNQWYLSDSTNEANILRNEIKDYLPVSDKIYQTTSFLKDSNDQYTFNHGKIGSFLKYNIDANLEVEQCNEITLQELGADVIVIDYVYEKETNNIKVLYKTKNNSENNIIQIKYNKLDQYDKLFKMSYEYDGKEYYQIIDLNYQKQINNNEIYFVIPKGVNVNFTQEYVKSENNIKISL
ncbi:ArnT family glycosyltransferase [Clostridium botulinum]|uniref:ArnT family glycosyltransferase n=1 Tax=Clostridium botulinum TaxID=1491 RepID=UPI001966FF73|nr:glycosyltransferase family 39 protein [Clostridium botulinum]